MFHQVEALAEANHIKFILNILEASVLYAFQSVFIYKAFQAVIFSQAMNVDFVLATSGIDTFAGSTENWKSVPL